MPSSRLVAFALVAAGVLPPVGLAALPGGLSMLGAPHTGIVLIAALLFTPALVGFAVALQGFDAALARLRAEAGEDYRQIIARVLLGALIVAYVFGVFAVRPGDPAIGPMLLIAALNLAAAWLFLLNVILDPRPSALRRYAALVSDIALLSILLAEGGALTAALALVYCYIAISNAEHHGGPLLVWALALEAAAFAAVVAASPYWRGQPLLAGGTLVTILALPAYVGAVLRRFRVAKAAAENANAAKNRFLTALGDDLRGPLHMIARAGATFEREALDPEQWDMIARMRMSARAMLLQLDDMLNYARIDGGTFAPERRSFDLYRLANGAIAALRAPAAERGIALALRIDPQLPYQLRGWPHQFRQIMICLITNAIRHSGKAKVGIDLDAVELAPDRVTLRLSVASTLADRRLETVDEQAHEGGRPLGLAVADRLVGLMGGRLAVETDPRRGLAVTVELPFAIDQASLALPLDLAHLPVLIVTRDQAFVGELIEPLEAWRGDPRWIGAGDDALAYLEAFDPGTRQVVLVVDGRGDVLQALAWAHRATEAHAAVPPYVLFVADQARIDSVIGLADGEFDGILPAPFTDAALRGALHALCVEPADWFLSDPRTPLDERDSPSRGAAEKPPTGPGSVEPSSGSARVADMPEPGPPDEPIRIASLRPQPRAQTAPPRRRREILVAASNPANRKILGSTLANAGYVVHFAEDVDEARLGLESRDVDALLLDLTGDPGADYAAAQQCRRARPVLPIIALSGDRPEIAERRGRDAGLDAVLPKPVEGRRLVAAIGAALDGESEAAEGPRTVVTALASHPRFAGESGPARAAAEPLWSANQEGAALQALIDTFRIDSARIVADIDRACGAGDVAAFEEAALAMRACAEVFGITRVRDTLATIRDPTPAKLRLQGADLVHRLEGDIARLDAALVDYLKSAK